MSLVKKGFSRIMSKHSKMYEFKQIFFSSFRFKKMATFQLNQELGQEGQVIVVDESIAEQLKNGTIVLTEKNGQMVLQHQDGQTIPVEYRTETEVATENQSDQKVTTEKLESELLKITEKVTNAENIVPDQDLIEKTNKLRRSLGLKPWKSDESSEKVVKTPQKKPKPKKLFQCGDCDYNNADMKSVNSHIRRLHRKPYKCDKCDYTNPSEKFVLNHIKMSHNPSSQVDSSQYLNFCFQNIGSTALTTTDPKTKKDLNSYCIFYSFVSLLFFSSFFSFVFIKFTKCAEKI